MPFLLFTISSIFYLSIIWNHACRNILLSAIRKLDTLLLQNQNINARRNEVAVPVIYDKLDILPIDNLESLKQFDQNLVKRDPENVDLQTQFRNKISSCGETEMKKAIIMTLPKILTNELGTKLVWMIKAEGKVPIQNFNFPEIIAIITIVEKFHSFPATFSDKYHCTKEDVKARIKLWLQKSGDRIRADLKKAEKNRDVAIN
ncbi:hypothetical protein TSAR_001409 [Trichomalopsis sarcophagae]|uniref:DUF4806 domain-containing protein n=1 Tax=Trichomalopsis sarcophagae TaxID=543379 RepID=A0A232EHE8_9HYME|nr:hypothetical protein TSAR_001409 [Trichomalopsis sarcophagae]